MAAPRIRHTASRQETESVRDDFMTQGYEVLNEGESTVLMRKSTWGSVSAHVIIALLTAWWTFGLVNLVYALIAHFTAPQVLLKQDGATPDKVG